MSEQRTERSGFRRNSAPGAGSLTACPLPAPSGGGLCSGAGMTAKPPKAVSDYMAQIGKKGGEAKGRRKARSPEHYARMVAARKKGKSK